MEIIRFNEKRIYQKDGILSFNYKNKKEIFGPYAFNKCFKEIYNWLYDNGYKFDSFKSVYNNNGNFYTETDIKNSKYESRLFVKLENSDKYFINAGNFEQLRKHLIKLLIDFGVDKNSIQSNFGGKEFEPEPIVETKVLKNPFMQSICILGESGIGKSYRIEKTLEQEGHEFELIIPSAASTNLLVQFKAGKGYILGKLGKIILEAAQNPMKLYTVVFDECHKYIDMINDELLQCISTRRNNGMRFISLDPDTDELFSELPLNRGRRIIPDNIGFIFASSKEEVLRENPDFKNRVDFIVLKEEHKKLDFAIAFLQSKIEKPDLNERFTY